MYMVEYMRIALTNGRTINIIYYLSTQLLRMIRSGGLYQPGKQNFNTLQPAPNRKTLHSNSFLMSLYVTVGACDVV